MSDARTTEVAEAIKAVGGECTDLTVEECRGLFGEGCLCWERAVAALTQLKAGNDE